MGLIHKADPHIRKPEGNTEIDWSNGLSHGLIGAWVFNEGAGTKARDLTYIQDGTLAGGAEWDLGENRRIDFSPSTTARVELSDLDIYSRLVSGTEMAIFAVGTLQSNLNQHLFSKEDEYALRFVQGVSTPYMRFDLYGANTGTATELALNQRFSFGCDWLAGTGGTLFVDGDVYKTSSSTDTSPNGTQGLNIGVRFSSISLMYEAAFTGTIEIVLFYDRRIGQQAHKKLTENPYQILRPRRRFYIIQSGTTFNQSVSGSSTPAGTLSSATTFRETVVGSSTATGALIKKTSVSFDGTLSSSGLVLKKISRALVGSITSTGSLASVLSSDILKTVTGSVTATGALTKKIFRSLTGTVSSTGNISKKTSVSLDGSVNTTGDPDKKMFQDASGSITPTGNLTASAPFATPPDDKISSGSFSQRLRRIYGTITRYRR